MKIITKVVSIYDRKFVLIQIEESDIKGKVNEEQLKLFVNAYGTISFKDITNGKLNRALSFLDLLTGKTINQALFNRQLSIETENMPIEEYVKYATKRFEEFEKMEAR